MTFVSAPLLGGLLGDGKVKATALDLWRKGEKGFTGSMPDHLTNLTMPDRLKSTVTRSFELNMGDGDQLATLVANWGNVCGEGGRASTANQ